MNFKKSILLFCVILTLLSCKNGKVNELNLSEGYLIEFEEFDSISSHEKIKIIDFRKPELYKKGHIINAVNVWRTDIENKTYPYEGMMAEKSDIEELFSDLGIENDDTIVVYDDNGLCDSSRLWWILQVYGFDKIKMLHGGFSLWKEGHEVTTEIPQIEKTKFLFEKEPLFDSYITKDEVFTALQQEKVILDTRTQDEYSGKRQKRGATKGGRIPKSILFDWTLAIDYHGDKKIKSIDKLKEIYKEILPYKNDTIIVYCQSGFRSSHTTFVLQELLGFKNIKNYDGAWVEWSYYHKDRPIEQDSITTIFQ